MTKKVTYEVRADTVMVGDHIRCSGAEGFMERVTQVEVRPATRTVFIRTVHHDHPAWKVDRMVECQRAMGRAR